MYPGVELRVMRYFLAVVAEMHFTRAAERVRVAQPSLSKQIRNLEGELGVQLLMRNRRRVELTEPGRLFAENAEQALLYAERAAAMARAAGAGRSGKLSIGVSSAIDLRLYFRIRAALNRQYPDVQTEVLTGSALQIAERLMRSDLHAGIVEIPIRCRSLSVLRISGEPIVLAISEKDVLASAKIIRPEQIQQRTLVLVSDEGDLAHHNIIAALASRGFHPRRVQPVWTTSQALDFVAAEQCIGVVRASATRFRVKGITYCPTVDLPMLDVGIAYRRATLTPPIRNFLRVVRQEFTAERKKMKESCLGE
jgi:DNA-binding transcriptional LysR family regulator